MAVNYEVPGVELVVQDQTMACWFASAMMLINWRERQSSNAVCRALDDETVKLYQANRGIGNAQILPLAKRLGLMHVSPMSPTPKAIENWLRSYGPLWTNGVTHIVVIAGIRGGDAQGYEVKVYDPAPGTGVSWRSLWGWYTGSDPGKHPESSRDAGAGVEAVFLHLPVNALSFLTLNR
ncbi:MAG: hypothetical protein M0R03_00120 [Novosphingobium sp.]|nr:hypothetical protein [Novosphingobium sp.]